MLKTLKRAFRKLPCLVGYHCYVCRFGTATQRLATSFLHKYGTEVEFEKIQDLTGVRIYCKYCGAR